MLEVIGVKFRKNNKIYWFDPDGIVVKKGDNVIVETARGVEFGIVHIENKPLESVKRDTKIPIKKILRKATEEDIEKNEDNIKVEREAYEVMKDKIKQYNLEMKLVSCEKVFDNSKLLFYFIAEGRIDFRELVKDIASIYKTRIELRQIGVRDEVKMLGESGICGRELCCNRFLNDFEPVSIKMAKEQGMSLNPTKISGFCGRLMCCLKYEQNVYEDKLSRLPKVGALVKTPNGNGTVCQVEILKEKVKVRFKKDEEATTYETYALEDIEIIKTDVQK